MAELSWTDAQWQKVNEAVNEAFGKASVASHPDFLQGYSHKGSSETVRNERLTQRATTVSLDVDHDALNLRFVNLRVHVDLSSEQVADETMANALLVFRRAANILAQEEDRIVFDGYQRGGNDSAFVANNPRPQMGLADPLARMRFRFLAAAGMTPAQVGNSVVPEVVGAIRTLEDASNPSPFACILGNRLFEYVYTPDPHSLVLPADRIGPIVKGPLLRSGQMNEFTGIVVSLAAGAVDIVVGTPPTVQFLQRTDEGRFLFRVYERFVLRVRDDGTRLPVAGFMTGDIPSASQAVVGAAINAANATTALGNATQIVSGAVDRVIDAANR
jgi:uncharacterized linocin/CFP29 family protein